MKLFSTFIAAAMLLSSCGGGGGGGGATVANVDSTAPSILMTYPMSGDLHIPITTSVEITFTEKMDSSTINSDTITVKDGTKSVSGTVAYNSALNAATFDPEQDLAFGTTYDVTVDSGVKDLAGNTIGADKTFSFTTGYEADKTAPEVKTIVPANNATGVVISPEIAITFNEAMKSSTITGSNIILLAGTTAVACTLSYDAGTNTAILKPKTSLAFETMHTVKVKTGVQDLSENPIASEFTSSFKTKNDTNPPVVSNSVPAANARNVAIGTNITITFSKNMDPSTINATNITLARKSNGAAVSGTLSYDDNSRTATFNPDSDLDKSEVAGTEYTVTVKKEVKDKYGYGFANNSSWTFYTTDTSAPAVSNNSFASASTNVSTTPDISFTFSENIDPSTITSANVGVKDASGNLIPGTLSYDTTLCKATFTPDYPLDYGTSYTVFANDNVKDMAGVALTGMTQAITTKPRKWTIMYYGDADCNLEAAIMQDIAEMKNGYVNDQSLDVIVLVDRHSSSNTGDGYSADSTTLGENFSDTRLFRITHGKAERISGSTQFPEITKSSTYEANVGDPNTLKKFVDFCKAKYTATNYALILANHGGGARGKTVRSSSSHIKRSAPVYREICTDETNNDDCLYTAEISEGLTSAESVNLLGFDACLMSSVEVAYQFRYDSSNTGFKAKFMVASAPNETGNGWQYTNILNRLKLSYSNSSEDDSTSYTPGTKEKYYDPSSLDARYLAWVIVEEQYDSTTTQSGQSLTSLILEQAWAFKDRVDKLAVQLATDGAAGRTAFETLLRNNHTAKVLHYFDDDYQDAFSNDDNTITYGGYFDWCDYPFFDPYDLASKIIASGTTGGFSAAAIEKAKEVKSLADQLIDVSFGNSDYPGFINGCNGVHMFIPYGNDTIDYDTNNDTIPDYYVYHWAFQDWYTSKDVSASGYSFGKLAWCIDNQNATANTVGNWFELLDSWYDDPSNDATGGMNKFQW
ncbi:MAG TPA: Ig-like domain-containing protein [Spirochaetota bacterium]|nr:Ig-like domain-containing protein [Spirochaetota bacterium]